MRRQPALPGFVLLFGLVTAVVAPAEDGEALRERVQQGEYQALTQILASLEAAYHGQPIDARLHRDAESDAMLYRVEWMGPDGQVVRFEVRARDGEIQRAEGLGLRELERP